MRRLLVDLGAIRSNVHALADHAPTAQVMAVVKADGYGHGLVPVARAAVAGGATWLGVAQVSEALALRAAGFTTRTLVWLYAPSAPLRELIDADIDVSVGAPWALAAVVAAARAAGRTARIIARPLWNRVWPAGMTPSGPNGSPPASPPRRGRCSPWRRPPTPPNRPCWWRRMPSKTTARRRSCSR